MNETKQQILGLGAEVIKREQGCVRFTVLSYYRKPVLQVAQEPGPFFDPGKKQPYREFTMEQQGPGLFRTTVEGQGCDLAYRYRLGNETFADPFSHYQPEGVHGWSRVVDHGAYRWQDHNWPGLELTDAVIYELHTGTFTPAGTFQGVLERLDYLRRLGVTALELMPVTQVPGRWNWGYDGAGLFSVNHNYGTPEALKRLVEEAHRRELAVILDVVYNHFGPEGNYLPFFGPFFTERYRTPWGAALNYDDAGCSATRRMILENVVHWLERYHFDGLRLDAVHAIYDRSPRHILQEIGETAREVAARLGKKIVVVAESDENDTRLISPLKDGGHGLDGQWMDDYHHCLHALLTGEKKGYYMDYGRLEDLPKVYRNYLYTGQYSSFWEKRRGSDASHLPGSRFVVAVQTHDQVGNRARGERLSHLIGPARTRSAAGLLLTAPYVPMLFMGEEYAETNPFLFFTDYSDPELRRAVVEGRCQEFARFGWEDIPDPGAEETFKRSGLTPEEQWTDENRQMLHYYRDLIRLRRTHPVLKVPDREQTAVRIDPACDLVEITRWGEGQRLIACCNLGQTGIPRENEPGHLLLDSEASCYGGNTQPGVLLPGQFLLYETKLVQ